MSLFLADSNGWVGDLGSASEAARLAKLIAKHVNTGPLTDFLDSGESTQPAAVVAELDKLIARVRGADPRLKLTAFRNKVKKCRGIATISM